MGGMIVTLSTERIRTLEDVSAFLEGSGGADITPLDRESAYAFIERALVRFRYHVGLDRKGKGLVRKFLAKVTGYSERSADQVDRSADLVREASPVPGPSIQHDDRRLDSGLPVRGTVADTADVCD